MDEQDVEDFKELCEAATDHQLINMAEYEIRSAKESLLAEDTEYHYECANIAYTVMEERNIV
jgi:hypothetical protein